MLEILNLLDQFTLSDFVVSDQLIAPQLNILFRLYLLLKDIKRPVRGAANEVFVRVLTDGL